MLFRIIRIHSVLMLCIIIKLGAYPNGWSDDILLTPEDNRMRDLPDIAIDNYNNVWVVWDSADFMSGAGEILFTKLDSFGACIIPETNVSNNASFSITPKIAVDLSDNIHFVWRDDTPLGHGLWHAKLANDGSILVAPHIAVSGTDGETNRVYTAMNRFNEIDIVWDEFISGYNQLNYTKLDSLGNPLILKNVVSPNNVNAHWPGIGTDSMANNHIAYRSDSGTPDRLAYIKLNRNGNTVINTKYFGYGAAPSLISDHYQNIHIIYSSERESTLSVKYLKLNQIGNALIGPKNLSLNHSPYIHIALDSLQFLHVIWPFLTTLDTFGIMYTKLDTLSNFVISPIPIIYPPYAQLPYNSRIAVDNNNKLHVIWRDQRLGVYDIYYKRGENDQEINEQNYKCIDRYFQLSIYPNPAVNCCNISFATQTTNNIKIDLYDISGCKIVSIENRTYTPGTYLMPFDACDIPSGVYFIVMKNDNETVCRKIVLRK